MKRSVLAVVTATSFAAIVAATAAEPRVEGQRDIERFQRAAGDEVQTMALPALVDWQALDDSALAVWTANDQPWLVRTQGPCEGLTKAESVALTARDGEVKVGTDYVELGATHCKIASIRSVDYKRVAAQPDRPVHRMRKAQADRAGA